MAIDSVRLKGISVREGSCPARRKKFVQPLLFLLLVAFCFTLPDHVVDYVGFVPLNLEVVRVQTCNI